MLLGIFARTFVRPGLEETLDAVKSYGLDYVQFNFSSAGQPTLPESIDPALAVRIRTGLEKRSLVIVAVSGTCNLIHPDPAHRAQCLRGLQTMITACQEFGTSIITLCTGTRDATDMWRWHPENDSLAARRDLRTSLERLLPLAEKHGVTLGIEPEPANVIATAQQARQLLDDLDSPCLKIIFDAANLLAPHDLTEQERVLSEAAHLLGADIVLAHAKDLSLDSARLTVAAGTGGLDYRLYLSLLERAGFNGAVVLHSLAETEVPVSVAFLRSQLNRDATRNTGESNALLQPRPN